MANLSSAGSADRAATGSLSPAHRTLLAVLVVIAAAVVVPLAALGQRQLLMLLLLPVGMVGAVILLRRPGLGFPLIVVSSLLIPFAISTGTQTRLNASLLLVIGLIGIWIFEMLAGKREVRLEDAPGVRPLLAFMVVSLLSMGFGQIQWLPARSASFFAQAGGLLILLLSPGLFLLTAHRLPDLKSLAWTVWVYLALAGVFVACLLIPSLQDFAFRTYQRAVMDSMFWTWLVTLSVSQSLLNRSLAKKWRVLAGLVGLAAFYYTIVLRQGWTSGWLPSLVSVIVILAATRPKWLVGLGLLAALVLLIQPNLLRDLFLGGDNEYSLTTRLEAWRILLDISRLNPILGLGPANYYNYTSLYNILGYSVSFNSHNNYIDIAAQIGLAGLACFLWFAWELWRLILRLRRRVPEGFARAYVYGALGGLAATLTAMMFGDWVLPFVYNVGLEGFRASGLAWMLLGGVLAVDRLTRHLAPEAAAAPAIAGPVAPQRVARLPGVRR